MVGRAWQNRVVHIVVFKTERKTERERERERERLERGGWSGTRYSP
jgi:hypothetical protein